MCAARLLRSWVKESFRERTKSVENVRDDHREQVAHALKRGREDRDLEVGCVWGTIRSAAGEMLDYGGIARECRNAGENKRDVVPLALCSPPSGCV